VLFASIYTYKGVFFSMTSTHSKGSTDELLNSKLVVKESAQQGQHLSELLRISLARSDDRNILRQIGENRIKRMRIKEDKTEKSFGEIEFREEARALKEDKILNSFICVKYDTSSQKKQLEKFSRKIIKACSRTEKDIKPMLLFLDSEAHLNQVMNGDWTTNSYTAQKEQLLLSTKQYDKNIRLLDTALRDESFDVYHILKICIDNSRNAFLCEFQRQEKLFSDISAKQNSRNTDPTTRSSNGNSAFLPAIRGNGNGNGLNENAPTGSGNDNPYGLNRRGNSSPRNTMAYRILLEQNTGVDKTIRRYLEECKRKNRNPNDPVKPKISFPNPHKSNNREGYRSFHRSTSDTEDGTGTYDSAEESESTMTSCVNMSLDQKRSGRTQGLPHCFPVRNSESTKVLRNRQDPKMRFSRKKRSESVSYVIPRSLQV